jgi:hypothetical protein
MARVTQRDGGPSVAVWVSGGRGRPWAEGADEVDGEVHGATAELEEAETGLKDGRGGPSAWRRSAVRKEGAPGVAERRQATRQRGEGEAGEDFSSQPTRVDKAAGDDHGSQWRQQGGVEGGPPVVTSAVALVRGTGWPLGAIKRPVQLTGGPRLHFIISTIFYYPNFEIRNGDLPYVQNLPNFTGRYIEIQETAFIFGSTLKYLRISS